jgi:hypothetical protein
LTHRQQVRMPVPMARWPRCFQQADERGAGRARQVILLDNSGMVLVHDRKYPKYMQGPLAKADNDKGFWRVLAFGGGLTRMSQACA